MDYPLHLSKQLKQLLKSLRKTRKMTQVELAQRLGVVQSRVADIEGNPGAISVEQLLQVLSMLGAQLVVRELEPDAEPVQYGNSLEGQARTTSTASAALSVSSKLSTSAPGSSRHKSEGAGKLDSEHEDEPRGQW